MTCSCRKIILTLILVISCTCVTMGQETGLQLYSLRNEFAKDVAGTMTKVKQFGVKSVEITGTYGLAFPDFIKLLAINELSVVSYGVDYNRLKDFPQIVADEARSYGAKYVTCFWIPHQEDSFNVTDVDRAAEVFNKAGRIMASNGLLLCYHPHGYEFKPYDGGTVFDYMMKKFESRYVQFEMDVFWIKQAGQDPMAVLKKYQTRWVLMHLKDRRKGTANTSNGKAADETNVPLGQGDVGITDLYYEGRRMGIPYFFIEDESPKAEQQIPKSMTFLKSQPPIVKE